MMMMIIIIIIISEVVLTINILITKFIKAFVFLLKNCFQNR